MKHIKSLLFSGHIRICSVWIIQIGFISIRVGSFQIYYCQTENFQTQIYSLNFGLFFGLIFFEFLGLEKMSNLLLLPLKYKSLTLTQYIWNLGIRSSYDRATWYSIILLFILVLKILKFKENQVYLNSGLCQKSSPCIRMDFQIYKILSQAAKHHMIVVYYL